MENIEKFPCDATCNRYKNDCCVCPIQERFDKLKEYEESEKNCTLVKLPCKPGTFCYYIKNGIIKDMRVESINISFGLHGLVVQAVCNKYDDGFSHFHEPDDFGKVIFLAREDAERALKEMEG
jgi:hypothetical protein